MIPAVRRHLRRLDTIALRATAIVASVLVLLLALGAYIYDDFRAKAAQEQFAQIVPRIVAAVTLLEQGDVDQWQLDGAVNSSTLRAAVYEDQPEFLKDATCYPLVALDSCEAQGEATERGKDKTVEAFGLGPLANALRTADRVHHSRVRALYFRDNEDAPRDHDYETRFSGTERLDLLPSRRKLIIALKYEVKDNEVEYAAFIVATDSISPGWAWRMAGWLLVVVAGTTLLAGLAAHVATGPVRRLSLADPAPEAGPVEIRRIAGALKKSHEEQEFLEKELSWTLASLTHDMRAALNRLRLCIEDMDDHPKRDRAEGDFVHMETMLRDAYEVARVSSNLERKQQVDLASLVQALCDAASDAGQTARYRGPDRMVLNCLPTTIRRALANLIDNAIAYGGEADVELSEDDEAVRIAIGDRGPGIPAAMREAAFQAYRQPEAWRSHETGGRGLGLPIAQRAIHRCGGDIELRDREGGGLEVLVSLPR